MKYFERRSASSAASVVLALGEQLEDQQRGDRARVRVVEGLEVVVAGDLAAELAALVAHAGLEERVADAVDQRAAAEPLRPCPAPPARRARRRGCRRPGVFSSTRRGEQRGQEVAGDELAGAVDEEAAVGVAVPGDPEVGAGLDHLADDELAVLGQQRVRLVVGELAVRHPVGLDEVERERLEDRPDHRAGHAVAAVEHDLQRLDRARVDDLQRLALEVRVDVDLLVGAAARGFAEAVLDVGADLLQAAVAGQRDAAALDHLRARVGLRVVAGGAHQAAVEVARADEPVEHLGADQPGVDDVRALGDHAVAVARGELGRRQAHVAPQADPQLARRLAGEVGESARARPRPTASAVSPSMSSP